MLHHHRLKAALCAATALVAGAAMAEDAPPRAEQAQLLVSDGVAAKPAGDPSCPNAVIAPNGGAFPARKQDYKATLGSVARDCADLGAETILKVAFVGEGSRDASGPSWFNAPVRLSVKDASGATVETRKIALKVQLPAGATTVAFRRLEENVSLPPAAGGYAGWSVVVGFDGAAAAAASAPKARRVASRPRPAKVAQRATPAEALVGTAAARAANPVAVQTSGVPGEPPVGPRNARTAQR